MRTETTSRSAIALFDSPLAARVTISRSRLVSSTGAPSAASVGVRAPSQAASSRWARAVAAWADPRLPWRVCAAAAWAADVDLGGEHREAVGDGAVAEADRGGQRDHLHRGLGLGSDQVGGLPGERGRLAGGAFGCGYPRAGEHQVGLAEHQ